MTVAAPPKFGMGASPRRIEDGSLIRGKGRYTADFTPPGALAAYVLRSSAAHAKIKVGDLSAARQAPGVHLVWSAADVTDLADMPSLAQGPAKDPVVVPPYPVLCGDTVRHVGDAIAFIVADDEEAARSAAELIEVDYESAADHHRYGARARRRTRRSSGPSAAATWLSSMRWAIRTRSTERVRVCGQGGRALHRQQPHRHQLHGAARQSSPNTTRRLTATR